jgi:hypothetical protein
MQKCKEKRISFVSLGDPDNYRDFVYLCDKALKIETVILKSYTINFKLKFFIMSPTVSPTKSPAWTGILQKTKKVLKWLLLIIVLFCCIFIYWKYFYTYSEGYRAGLLQKFSHKGAIFKTYEGEIILSSVSSNRDVTLASEKFLFTVTNKKLVRQFDTLQGENVIVHYMQKNSTVFWRGDSPYLVDSVKVRR